TERHCRAQRTPRTGRSQGVSSGSPTVPELPRAGALAALRSGSRLSRARSDQYKWKVRRRRRLRSVPGGIWGSQEDAQNPWELDRFVSGVGVGLVDPA
ncbi:hypothetical protein LEMLEM_LOCUS8951, partial [Lemmus lemmus]